MMRNDIVFAIEALQKTSWRPGVCLRGHHSVGGHKRLPPVSHRGVKMCMFTLNMCSVHACFRPPEPSLQHNMTPAAGWCSPDGCLHRRFCSWLVVSIEGTPPWTPFCSFPFRTRRISKLRVSCFVVSELLQPAFDQPLLPLLLPPPPPAPAPARAAALASSSSFLQLLWRRASPFRSFSFHSVICSIMMPSISLRFVLTMCMKVVHAASLMATSCHPGCDAACAPTCWLLLRRNVAGTMRFRLPRPCACIAKPILRASPVEILACTWSVVNELLDVFNRSMCCLLPCSSSVGMLLATFVARRVLQKASTSPAAPVLPGPGVGKALWSAIAFGSQPRLGESVRQPLPQLGM